MGHAGHPAPWPLLHLEVPAGHVPVPFRQFVLKINSRCNLACDYCYVYEMADQSWRGQPRRMSPRTLEAVAVRLAEHAVAHRLGEIEVILHGGEPLLAGPAHLAQLIAALRAAVPARVNVTVQTNGTLLDRAMLTVLAEHGVRAGVSLDGDAEATARHRRYAGGRDSHSDVARGLALLSSPEFRACYAGILCTAGLDNDPVTTYEALLEFEPPAIDLLLPHGTWSAPPPGLDPLSGGTPYADWMLAVFERWYTAPVQETSIRFFTEIIQLVLGAPGGVEGLGLLPSSVVVVDTDGSIKQLDSLTAAYPGAADLGLNVETHPFDAALRHPMTVARQLGLAALPGQCRRCPVVRVCGGGLYPHRYRQGEGFRNPSVYCADLLRIITHIQDRVATDVRAGLRAGSAGLSAELSVGPSVGLDVE